MRLSVPHMGNLYIAFKSLFEQLGVDYVLPPASSRRTLTLGAKYSPEGLCIPFKLTTGNIIEAAELGADTILMPGGTSICRLGYYADAQEKILQEIGFNNVRIINVGVSGGKLSGFFSTIKRLSNNASWIDIVTAFRFAVRKTSAIDEAERAVFKIRPREVEKGAANKIYEAAIKAIDAARNDKELTKARHHFKAQFAAVPQDPKADPLVVNVMGEFFVVLDPFSNFDVENELGKLRVEVRRTLYISDWLQLSYFFNPFAHAQTKRLHRAALPYVKRDIGGEGWESVGEKVYHHDKLDGLIHLGPFTCMPEIIASNILPTTREKLPVLDIWCDEQMAKAGLVTRLEAFVDLLARQRRTKYNNSIKKDEIRISKFENNSKIPT
jgi:predicted nucleotide-binding protein (sugar kinase/HSP70/actin superfamily)